MKAKRPAVGPTDRAKPDRFRLGAEDQALFLAAVSDAKPLPARDRIAVPPPPPSPVRAEILPPEVKLSIEGDHRRYAARAPGVSLAQVAELRTGKMHLEATLDLHGATVDVAIGQLRQFLVESRRLGRRRVLVIHGKGLHSEPPRHRSERSGLLPGAFGAPLREAVLADLLGPSSGLVHALASAVPADGGDGATYVMLRGGK